MKSPWLTAIHTGLALLLLTPLVWAPGTFYPFSVGKAVYARSLIAVVFALWGLVAALVAIARAYAPELAIPGLPPEARPHRISATTDNPTFLGAYMQVTALLAAGFLARSWTRAPALTGWTVAPAPATGYGIGDRTRALR